MPALDSEALSYVRYDETARTLFAAFRGGRTRRYVYEDVDRHGNVRIYFWRGKGHLKVRILEKPGTEAFDKRYHELVHQSAAGAFKPPPRDIATPGTFRWICTEYLASAHFRRLDKATQTARRRVLEAIFKEPVHPGSKEQFADFPLERLTMKSLRVLRDRKACPWCCQPSRQGASRGVQVGTRGRAHYKQSCA